MCTGEGNNIALYKHCVISGKFCCSVIQLCSTLVTPWTAACQASLSFTISQSLLKLTSIELVVPSNHFILPHTLLLSPSVFPSIRVFSSESALHIRWPKYWSFSLSISPSNEYSELISFRIDLFDLFAVQETLKSSPAPQFKSINPSSEYSGLISFSVDWFDLFAVQETLKSLLQHHNLKASALRCSALFMV